MLHLAVKMQSFVIEIENARSHPDGVRLEELAHEAEVILDRHVARIALRDVVGPKTRGQQRVIDGAIEQYAIVGLIEMAVVVHLALLDRHDGRKDRGNHGGMHAVESPRILRMPETCHGKARVIYSFGAAGDGIRTCWASDRPER